MNQFKHLDARQVGHLPGVFRPAIMRDVPAIQKLIKLHADKGQMLPRSVNELYETIRQYLLYEERGKVLGVCGLHVTWEDLAEVRALAVDPCLGEARRLGIPKVFTLTYVPDFFRRLGFEEVEKTMFPHKIWSECIRCHKFPDCDETGLVIVLDLDKDEAA
ncbi:MAG: GNAT family N-acetyltransferase [Nitrospinae bacterium]|nr:GNAT family N-acetyltransferase [Nitrospinota bacterium]